MKMRFIVKPVKIVWRNSMLAGNPIERSFKKFGIYDRNWENDRWCRCPRPGGEWATNNGQPRKFRLVLDDENKARYIAAKMNTLAASIGGESCQIEFGIDRPCGICSLSSYIKDEDLDRIIITNYQK